MERKLASNTIAMHSVFEYTELISWSYKVLHKNAVLLTEKDIILHIEKILWDIRPFLRTKNHPLDSLIFYFEFLAHVQMYCVLRTASLYRRLSCKDKVVFSFPILDLSKYLEFLYFLVIKLQLKKLLE